MDIVIVDHCLVRLSIISIENFSGFCLTDECIQQATELVAAAVRVRYIHLQLVTQLFAPINKLVPVQFCIFES